MFNKAKVDIFDISRIQIKIPAEHKMDKEENIVGEILVNAISEEGELGILSILMKVGDDQNP